MEPGETLSPVEQRGWPHNRHKSSLESENGTQAKQVNQPNRRSP